jgi:hypothetical protein
MTDEKRIIEINGIKLEVDMRTAKNVESYKIGDRVKVLIQGYGEDFKSYPGVIVGFDNFKVLPTILIAYLEAGYYSAEIKFVTFNNKTPKIEICPVTVTEEIFLKKSTIVDLLDKEILAKQEAIKDLKLKKDYFLRNFNKYFEEVK